ncbi:MAG TPA: hypothetical protein GXX65_00765 [Methanosarcina sp.]|nr:hypothetical protein [Methanosarcina sp.]
MKMVFPDTNCIKTEGEKEVKIEEFNILIDKFNEHDGLKEEIEELNKLIDDSQRAIAKFPERFSLKIGVHSLEIRKQELLEKEANLKKEIEPSLGMLTFNFGCRSRTRATMRPTHLK